MATRTRARVSSLRGRSRSPPRVSPPKVVEAPPLDFGELIEDFQPLTDDDLYIGVKQDIPEEVKQNLIQLNNALKALPPTTKPRDFLAYLLGNPDMQKTLRRHNLILKLNDQETEFIFVSDPSKQSTPPAPPATTVPSTTARTLGFGGFDVDLTSHSMRVALFFQQTVVKFAVAIAGKLTSGGVDTILETGFEDLIRLSGKAAMNQQEQQALSQRETPLSTAGIPAFKVENWQAAFSERELQVLEQLRAVATSLNNTQNAMEVYTYLNTQQSGNQHLYNQWMTLPINLSQIYFKPYVQAGIDEALSDLDGKINVPRHALFYTLINSDACAPFAALVAVLIKRNQSTKPNSGTTQIQFNQLDVLERRAIQQLQNCTYQISSRPGGREDPSERRITNYSLPTKLAMSKAGPRDYSFF